MAFCNVVWQNSIALYEFIRGRRKRGEEGKADTIIGFGRERGAKGHEMRQRKQLYPVCSIPMTSAVRWLTGR